MPALAQKQNCTKSGGMSALPPEADMCGANYGCPLSANSGHGHMFALSALLPNVEITSARWAFVTA